MKPNLWDSLGYYIQLWTDKAALDLFNEDGNIIDENKLIDMVIASLQKRKAKLADVYALLLEHVELNEPSHWGRAGTPYWQVEGFVVVEHRGKYLVFENQYVEKVMSDSSIEPVTELKPTKKQKVGGFYEAVEELKKISNPNAKLKMFLSLEPADQRNEIVGMWLKESTRGKWECRRPMEKWLEVIINYSNQLEIR